MMRSIDPPSYLALLESGELHTRVEEAALLLSHCRVCPHGCGVDRNETLGLCRIPASPVMISFTPHFGEEPPLSGSRGSGTVFMGGCNLQCVYCQNHQISQPERGSAAHRDPASIENITPQASDLAKIFLALQARGCHNINWVSPSHQAPQLLSALLIAAEHGLHLPIVYNTNAYDSLEMLRLLDGVVDIYLPDLKYADEDNARLYSGASNYPAAARAAIKEMYRQLSSGWKLDEEGTLRRGLLIRLLVLPNQLAGLEENLQWLADNLSPEISISLMAQYRPDHLVLTSERYPLLSRPISCGEWERALESVEKYLPEARCFIQNHREAPGYYLPDFSRPEQPFPDIEDF